MMITYNSFILFGFILRVLFVGTGVFLSIKIIGFKNIKFLKKYVEKSFFSVTKLFYWLIVFLSIVHFEHLVSDAKSITFYETFSKSTFFSILSISLLLGVVVYAYIDMKQSIKQATETKKELSKAQTTKKVTKIVNVFSIFVPGGIWVKGAVFVGSKWLNNHVDNKIKNTLSSTIMKNIEAMLLIALLNLTIILMATYLITDQIIFW